MGSPFILNGNNLFYNRESLPFKWKCFSRQNFTIQYSSFSKWKSCRNNNFEMENAFGGNCKNVLKMGKASIKNILEMRIFHFTIGKTCTFEM